MNVFRNLEGGAYSDFDSTLGYPGEGPCSLCGESGHNILTCPMLYEEPPSKVPKKTKPQGSSTPAAAPQSLTPAVPSLATVTGVPATPGTSRVYCPVVGCSKNCPQFAAGWTNTQAMRPHLEEHIQGRLQGSLPEEFLTGHSLSICQVCSKLIAT
eukprot:2991518-Amphidinium_carterae.2